MVSSQDSLMKGRSTLMADEDYEQRWDGPFQILSLDGGGIRGLFSAAVLAALEDDLDTTITDHFDLIVGTSTGGIIALALGLGLTPREIVEFYVNQGPVIFPDCPHRRFLRFFRRKYDQGPLRKSVQDVMGKRLLGESTKRLVIPSYDLGHDHVHLFKTPHHTRLRRDWKIPAWKVALATSAAPTFFPACRHVDDTRLIDGGVWANNPTMVGIIEAKSMMGVPLDEIKVFSLGTCDDLNTPPDKLDQGGMWQWRNEAVRVIMRGQSVGTDTMAVHLLGPEKVHRLDPKVPAGLFGLDRVTADKLVAQASHTSRHFSPIFTQYFQQHIAQPYEPHYRQEPPPEPNHEQQ